MKKRGRISSVGRALNCRAVERLTAEREVVGSISGAEPILKVLK